MSENNEKKLYLNFDEYIRQGDPQKKERAESWRVAIGLQAVDGLKGIRLPAGTCPKKYRG